MATAASHGGAGRGACARGGATRSLASKLRSLLLSTSSGQFSASRRLKVDRQLVGDQRNGVSLERIVDVVAAPLVVLLIFRAPQDPDLSLPSLAGD